MKLAISAAAALVLLSGCVSPPSAAERQVAETRCEKFGGVDVVTACTPPRWCGCSDGATIDYEGIACAQACAAHGGESPTARLSIFYSWFGGEARCADGSEFRLPLAACARGGELRQGPEG